MESVLLTVDLESDIATENEGMMCAMCAVIRAKMAAKAKQTSSGSCEATQSLNSFGSFQVHTATATSHEPLQMQAQGLQIQAHRRKQ